MPPAPTGRELPWSSVWGTPSGCGDGAHGQVTPPFAFSNRVTGVYELSLCRVADAGSPGGCPASAFKRCGAAVRAAEPCVRPPPIPVSVPRAVCLSPQACRGVAGVCWTPP